MRLSSPLTWSLAMSAVLLGTAAIAQQGSAVTEATDQVNYARQSTVGRGNVTNNQAYGRTGIDKVGEKSAITVDQTQETKLSPDEKWKLANALLSDMRAASNSLTASIGKAEGQADTPLAKCLRDIQKTVSQSTDAAEELTGKLDTPGMYGQLREHGRTAQTALLKVKTCPTKAANLVEGASVTMTVAQVLADQGRSTDFPVTNPPMIVLPPPCASCIR